MSDDPLCTLSALAASLEALHPQRYYLTPEEWHNHTAAADNARHEVAAAQKHVFAALRRFLRAGLDNDSFAEARREVDNVQALVLAVVSAEMPIPMFGCEAVDDDGTTSKQVLYSHNSMRPVRERLQALSGAVASLARWRDCMRPTPPPSEQVSRRFVGDENEALAWVTAMSGKHPKDPADAAPTSAPATATQTGEGENPRSYQPNPPPPSATEQCEGGSAPAGRSKGTLDRLEENRQAQRLAEIDRIESAANTWLDLFHQQQTGPLNDAQAKQIERCRRFLVSMAKDNPNPIPGEDFADVVLHLRKMAVLLRGELSLANSRRDQSATQQGEGGTPKLAKVKANRVGRRNLLESGTPEAQARCNVYLLIAAVKNKNPAWGKKELHKHFKSDKDFQQRVTDAGLKCNVKLFHAALMWLKNNPSAGQKTAGQETRS